SSSVQKGETLKDTIRNIASMKIDMVVVRHQSPGAAHFISRCVDAAVLNAGDGAHEHPTQALLDLFSIRQKLGRLEGLKVVIIGDITHSRVVRSNIYGMKRLGMKVVVCGPKTMMPLFVEDLGVTVSHDLESCLEWCDVAMALRIQLERQDGALFPSLREYHDRFGIKKKHLSMFPGFTIMHPGPINRGVELESEVADSPRSIILSQVTNGLAVRMAALYLLSGGMRE
ncbi:aspartate carbamoyltransferase catalytic subunit, partial [Balneolaceae bacterium ANBcel3]|nr:aspartate carbamoyltransferase catalytic subunit [Balneolaceae bacterium ANBcel3]